MVVERFCARDQLGQDRASDAATMKVAMDVNRNLYRSLIRRARAKGRERSPADDRAIGLKDDRGMISGMFLEPLQTLLERLRFGDESGGGPLNVIIEDVIDDLCVCFDCAANQI